MSTTAPAVTNVAPAAPAAGTQEAVNAAPNFDVAANTILDYDPQAPVNAAETAPVQEKTDGAASTADATKVVADGAKPGEAAPAAAAAAVVDPWAIDAKQLEVGLAHPELGGLVKQMQGQLAEAAKWREFFPSVEEAREFKSMAPGGVEELKTKVQAGVDARMEQAEFASGDPARQGAVLQAIAAENPQAFASAAKPWLETLKASNPEAYNKIGMEVATEALTADGMPAMLTQLFDALGKEDEKGFAEAIGKLGEWRTKAGFATSTAPGKQPEQKLTPELQRALDENKAYKDRERTELMNGFKTWKEGLDTNFQKAAKEEIRKAIEDADAIPKNIATKPREWLMSRISNEIFAEIEKQLNADLDLGKNVAKVIENNAWKTSGEQTRTQVHNLYFGRAKQLLPYVARDILNPFTEATVAAANNRAEREEKSTQRIEVSTAGSAGSQRSKPLTKKDVAGMTDEQILDM
jgi:hypothetical protein